MSQQQLKDELLQLSNSQSWDVARTEWNLYEVYENPNFDTCTCGHYPIKECCILHNRLTRNKAMVGNCCVKNFMGLPSDLIFQAVKRVRTDRTKSLNQQTLDYGLSKGWVSDWEYRFYMNIMRKRSLTYKQAQKKEQVNYLFMLKMERARTA